MAAGSSNSAAGSASNTASSSPRPSRRGIAAWSRAPTACDSSGSIAVTAPMQNTIAPQASVLPSAIAGSEASSWWPSSAMSTKFSAVMPSWTIAIGRPSRSSWRSSSANERLGVWLWLGVACIGGELAGGHCRGRCRGCKRAVDTAVEIARAVDRSGSSAVYGVGRVDAIVESRVESRGAAVSARIAARLVSMFGIR